jgi:hypothetical protein
VVLRDNLNSFFEVPHTILCGAFCPGSLKDCVSFWSSACRMFLHLTRLSDIRTVLIKMWECRVSTTVTLSRRQVIIMDNVKTFQNFKKISESLVLLRSAYYFHLGLFFSQIGKQFLWWKSWHLESIPIIIRELAVFSSLRLFLGLHTVCLRHWLWGLTRPFRPISGKVFESRVIVIFSPFSLCSIWGTVQVEDASSETFRPMFC